MFSTAFAPAPGHAQAAGHALAQAYRSVGAQTAIAAAGPHRLVAMLFDGALDAMVQAKGALRGGRIDAKCHAIGRAARIVDEGLRAALNLRDGGELAADLQALYSYLGARLTLANLRNDEALLDECHRLLVPLRDAWHDIGPRVAGAGH